MENKSGKKIRILHIISNMRLGGAQVCLKNIVDGNIDPNIEHFIYPLRAKNAVFKVNCKQFVYNFPNYDPRKFFALLKICKEYQIDIIHAHLTKPSILAMLSRFLINVKIIVHDHGNATHSGLQAKFYRLIQRIFKKNATIFISISKSNRSGLINNIKIDNSKIQLLPNCIDDSISKFSKSNKKSELNISPDNRVICFCGRLSKIKNPIIVLETLLNLNQITDKFTTIFLGDGPLKTQLVKFIKRNNLDKKVRILGFVEKPGEFMNFSDYAMIPSQDEGFSLTALEFMKMKVPILCSGAGGLKEQVKDHETGIIIENNSPIDYANAIMQLEDDKGLKNRIIENAFIFSENFTRDKYIKKLNDIYYELMK